VKRHYVKLYDRLAVSVSPPIAGGKLSVADCVRELVITLFKKMNFGKSRD
jgi:hypothetical protein